MDCHFTGLENKINLRIKLYHSRFTNSPQFDLDGFDRNLNKAFIEPFLQERNLLFSCLYRGSKFSSWIVNIYEVKENMKMTKIVIFHIPLGFTIPQPSTLSFEPCSKTTNTCCWILLPPSPPKSGRFESMTVNFLLPATPTSKVPCFPVKSPMAQVVASEELHPDWLILSESKTWVQFICVWQFATHSSASVLPRIYLWIG